MDTILLEKLNKNKEWIGTTTSYEFDFWINETNNQINKNPHNEMLKQTVDLLNYFYLKYNLRSYGYYKQLLNDINDYCFKLNTVEMYGLILELNDVDLVLKNDAMDLKEPNLIRFFN